MASTSTGNTLIQFLERVTRKTTQSEFSTRILCGSTPRISSRMFRNQYDQDVLTWSPQGRLHQIEYAMEAVKQGGATVGFKSKEYVVLATLNRVSSELSSSQKKIFKIDDNVGVAISGLTADGTAAAKELRAECITHKFTFGTELDMGRMAARVADRSQISTQRSGARPAGVGLLIGGVDDQGCHLYQTCPSGNIYDHVAVAIGARTQASRTFLENNIDDINALSVDELVGFALRALKEATADVLSAHTCSVAFLGKGLPFQLLEKNHLATILARMEQ